MNRRNIDKNRGMILDKSQTSKKNKDNKTISPQPKEKDELTC